MKHLVAALSLILLSALAVPAGASELRIALDQDPDVLDPAQAGTYVGRIVFAAMCDKLVDVDEHMKFVPQLATSWDWSPDNKALTLKLRDNVLFQDGTKLDAKAVKINLDRYRTAPESKRKGEVKAIGNVVVVDPLTVRLELSAPYAPLVAVLSDRAGMIVSPKALAQYGDKIADHLTCAGPYRFVERVAQGRIVAERFKDYWNAAAYSVDRVTYTPVTDQTVRLDNLRAGQFDIIEGLAATDVKAVEGDPKLQFVEATGLAYELMSINLNNGPDADNPLGKDKRVREALELSLDRNVLNQVVFDGKFVPSNQPEAPGGKYWNPARPVPARDVEKAKALLAAAGAPHPSFTLTAANSPVEQQLAQLIQAMAGEAGFQVKIQATEATTMVANNNAGHYQAGLAIWSGRPDPDGNLSIWLACDGFLNWGKYCSADLDKTLAEARATTDPDARAKLYATAGDIYLNGRPALFLYHYKWLWGVNRKVSGFVPYPDGIARLGGVKVGS
jgi:peptide/nickel transport system substrate-binding protein